MTDILATILVGFNLARAAKARSNKDTNGVVYFVGWAIVLTIIYFR